MEAATQAEAAAQEHLEAETEAAAQRQDQNKIFDPGK
jgi:hypothetical protein